MRMMTAAAFVLLAPIAQAAPTTGAELLQRCGAYEKSVDGGDLTTSEGLDAMWCMGYVGGLLDGFGVADFRIANARAVCPPEEGLSRTQALRLITRWLREHPEDQEKSGRRGAILALSQALPCKEH